jgi:Transposase DNA-binding
MERLVMQSAREEFEAIDLGDKRLDERLKTLAETLADKPGASIPGACAGRAETVAAYRLLAHEDVGWRDSCMRQTGNSRIWTHSAHGRPWPSNDGEPR